MGDALSEGMRICSRAATIAWIASSSTRTTPCATPRRGSDIGGGNSRAPMRPSTMRTSCAWPASRRVRAFAKAHHITVVDCLRGAQA
jgi:hypothetical protein